VPFLSSFIYMYIYIYTYTQKRQTSVPPAGCGRSLAGIAGSNPAGGMDVCLF
jgi:hypothetical protein